MKALSYIWNSNWALSITAGLLLGLSFPPFPLPFLTLPAFILIFRLVERADSARQAAYFIYPGFIVWNLVTTYWLMLASVGAGIGAIMANAAVMTVPVMLQKKVDQYLKRGWTVALLQTGFWIGFEYLHHHWDLAWPWLSVGNAWANVPTLVHYISATGYLGISFWIVLSAALAFQALRGRNQTTYAYSFLGVLLFFPLVSLIQVAVTDYTPDRYLETVVVQPNFDSYERYGGFSNSLSALNHMIELSDSVRTDRTDVVIWPENGIHPSISNKSFSNSYAGRVKEILHEKTQKWNTTLIGGTTYFEYYELSQVPPLPMGTREEPYLVFNSALAFYPDSTYRVYRKHNLVPIVERIPFVRFLDTIDLFGWINWNKIQGYGKGENLDQFLVDGTQTPALVCYDSVFPSWVGDFVREGAGFITVITNDGWWGHTSGHIQHFDYARLRALEFRRWVVRSANNGISGVIAPDGSVKVKTEYWTATSFNYRVPVLTEMTFYARWGDWFPQLCLLFALTGLVFAAWKQRAMSN